MEWTQDSGHTSAHHPLATWPYLAVREPIHPSLRHLPLPDCSSQDMKRSTRASSEKESPKDSPNDYKRLSRVDERIDVPLKIKHTSMGVSRTDAPTTETIRHTMRLWPRTPLRAPHKTPLLDRIKTSWIH
ncbi:hypothetical protein BCR37DRAFT_90988 [Protomyces lactucae-debilis]|uniref:Uncharacterized protein n=1 Tax=Protomyces lactucae-debilis TaxID=2754530 RepID=A0A1Y2F6B0_PROLT|nr:uncharacterized protein BCR37DRAFT_90988 [Protomyces lactucae-debilis]ORY79440.1 hypothetical protein BCR37DRAFT_90988 [Protomyces lactucae-debilis]